MACHLKGRQERIYPAQPPCSRGTLARILVSRTLKGGLKSVECWSEQTRKT
jgi:hypothetical protein